MADGYLPDNNVISILARPGDSRHPHVKGQFAGIGDAKVALPVIAIAEIEFGMAKATATTPDQLAQRAAVRKFFTDHPWHLGVDDGTVEPYAIVRARLWELFGTPKNGKKRGHQEKLPDQLRDRATGQWIGIDERDLLIVSIALQYNLVFATVDRNAEMKRIEQAVNDVVSAGKWPKPLALADWTPPKV
ncbi:MAG TPA: type II toxin-antitoxin system VapC family toxin [Gemmataceae bacterium]|jgi:predicted nucleic acid-binding protein